MEDLQKQSDFIGDRVKDVSSLTGLSLEAAKQLLMYGVPLAVGGPLLGGYALGKARGKMKQMGSINPEELQRELLKKKYDDAILAVGEKNKLV